MRNLISLILVVVMLPWGAYAGGLAKTAQIAVAKDVIAADQVCTDHRAATDVSHASVKVSAKRKCRTSTLPVPSCGPDRVLLGTELTFGPPAAVVTRVAPADWSARTAGRSPPLVPPRST